MMVGEVGGLITQVSFFARALCVCVCERERERERERKGERVLQTSKKLCSLYSNHPLKNMRPYTPSHSH